MQNKNEVQSQARGRGFEVLHRFNLFLTFHARAIDGNIQRVSSILLKLSWFLRSLDLAIYA